MDLYLIRHAEAVPLGERGISDDADRPLTEEGVRQAQALAGALQQKGIVLKAVVTSPLLRAQQTAQEILHHWKPPGPELLVCEDLAPGGKARKLARFLRGRGEDRVALVGHQPDLSQFAAWLIGSKKAQLDLAKGGGACISCPDGPRKGSGTLLWLVTREWLSKAPKGR